jgi:methylmalonyl-CoA mutase N-terminal domain/subunit
VALERLKGCAQGADNLMPPIMEAVKCYATLGEICDTLRAVFGEYTAVSTL